MMVCLIIWMVTVIVPRLTDAFEEVDYSLAEIRGKVLSRWNPSTNSPRTAVAGLEFGERAWQGPGRRASLCVYLLDGG